jgi:hypothetical protein
MRNERSSLSKTPSIPKLSEYFKNGKIRKDIALRIFHSRSWPKLTARRFLSVPVLTGNPPRILKCHFPSRYDLMLDRGIKF